MVTCSPVDNLVGIQRYDNCEIKAPTEPLMLIFNRVSDDVSFMGTYIHTLLFKFNFLILCLPEYILSPVQ